MVKIIRKILESSAGRTIGYSFLAYAGIISLFFVLDWKYQLADPLGLWQVVIELALVPIVVYGFLRTREDFRESQQKPILVPEWFDGVEYSSTTSMKVDSNNSLKVTMPHFTMKNYGKRMSRFWQILFQMPDEYLFYTEKFQTKMTNGNLSFLLYDKSLLVRANDSPFFPDERIGFREWNVISRRGNWDAPLVIKYTIYADLSEEKKGELKLIFLDD